MSMVAVRRWTALLLAGALGCGRGSPPPQTAAAGTPPPPEQEPPVALNPDPPIQYPPALFDQSVEGSVVLRLFVDSTGRLRAESTKVAESSGYPALDSAAVAGASKLLFAPGKRHGVAVATAFLQPVEFRHDERGAAAAPPTAPPTPRPRRIRRTVPDTTVVHADTATPADTTKHADTLRVKTDTNAPGPSLLPVPSRRPTH